MRSALLPSVFCLLLFGCLHRAPQGGSSSAGWLADGGLDTGALPAGTLSVFSSMAADAGGVPGAEEVVTAEDDTDDDSDGPAVEEEESHQLAAPGTGLIRYTGELSDEDLADRWTRAPETLGCMSLGFADEGRLINAEKFPADDDWWVVSPERAWATHETIDYVKAAIEQVKALHPAAPPIRINQISAKEGGYLRPHKSHQNGRDVDLGFYYPTKDPVRARNRERYIDVELTWALLKALITETDVQLILVDKHIQKALYTYAVREGEDKTWLDHVFHAGRHGLVQHARHHRDHFHVRFYNPVAQEMGRRIAPLLGQRPEQNLAMHRVRSGDTLGAIARKYRSSVAAMQKINHLKGTRLRLAQVLKVPLRGPCTRCPVPAPVNVPGRLLPPSLLADSSEGGHGGTTVNESESRRPSGDGAASRR